MAAPVLFVEAEYAAPPCTGLETREADGTWLGVTAYTHAARGTVVLWYGSETYEGLGGGYRWAGRGAPPSGPGSSGDAPELLDGDGDVVPTRWLEVGGRHAQAAAEGAVEQPQFLPFGEALSVARSLGLASRFEWREWCKEGMRPPKVPSCPNEVYKGGGWQGWVHWLGSGDIKKASKFVPFAQALAFARSLNLDSSTEWEMWCKEGMRPPNVPSHPNQAYEDGGWQGWGHWLGTGNTQCGTEQFLPFDEALAVARSLGLASVFEWKVWCKEGMRPPNVPSHPERTYKDGGWQGWVHWLGSSGIKKASKFAPFSQALTFARSLGHASMREWHAWCKEGIRPPNVPSAPQATYKDSGWQGWGHWLGTGNTRNVTQPLPFAEALAVARSLNLASQKEWAVWCKEGRRPPNVPSHPNATYKGGGWQGWGHWLGTGNQSSKAKKARFLPFDEALRVARQLRLVSQKEWQLWCRSGARPANVPAAPHQVYVHDGWFGYEHWLYHANLDPAPVPTVDSSARKRAAPGRANTAGNNSRGKRQRR